MFGVIQLIKLFRVSHIPAVNDAALESIE